MNYAERWSVEHSEEQWYVIVPIGESKTDRVFCKSEDDANRMSHVPELLGIFKTPADVKDDDGLQSLKQARTLLMDHGRGHSPFVRWIDRTIFEATARLKAA